MDQGGFNSSSERSVTASGRERLPLITLPAARCATTRCLRPQLRLRQCSPDIETGTRHSEALFAVKPCVNLIPQRRAVPQARERVRCGYPTAALHGIPVRDLGAKPQVAQCLRRLQPQPTPWRPGRHHRWRPRSRGLTRDKPARRRGQKAVEPWMRTSRSDRWCGLALKNPSCLQSLPLLEFRVWVR
jgi:hypothetical protein